MTRPTKRSPARTIRGAFTLMEIMMVVAIIGLLMTMSVPAILRTMHQEPLRKAVNDVINICGHARSQAILRGMTTTVVFHPQSGTVTLSGAANTPAPGDLVQPDPPADDTRPAVPGAAALNTTQFGEGVMIDMLDVNLTEYKDADEARVRFFPNGTSDEMTLVLHSGDQYRKITLEVTTALASMQVIQ